MPKSQNTSQKILDGMNTGEGPFDAAVFQLNTLNACHPERSAAKKFPSKTLVGAESKDPDCARATMLQQGIST
jgi:hypothetical protein